MAAKGKEKFHLIYLLNHAIFILAIKNVHERVGSVYLCLFINYQLGGALGVF